MFDVTTVVVVVVVVVVLESASFEYDDFFRARIDAKKRDHSYRVFKKVSRKASQFPVAQEVGLGEDITVWCSNDYLGMSWHPTVQAAVM